MYTLVILIVLCLVQFIYLWSKWEDIKEWHEIGTAVVETVSTGSGKGPETVRKVVIPAKKATSLLITLFAKFKHLLLIPIGILFIVNFIVSFVVGTITHLIVNLIA